MNDIDVTLVLPKVSADGTDHPDIVTADMSGCAVLSVPSAIRAYDDARSFAERLGHAGSKTHDLYGPNLAAAVEQYTVASVEASKDIVADVVHCHDWMTYAAGEAAAKMRQVPMIAHIHATELDRTDGHPDPWIFKREKRGFKAAHTIIAVSQYTKNVLVREYGIDPQKISVVHNGHDPEAVRSAPALMSRHGKKRHPMVLFLGRLTVQKNPLQFIAVAKQIHQLRGDVQFVMAGSGPMQGELMERACADGLGGCMVFAGQVAKREANALYAAADCFVMPSLSEPFGLVALEAIAQGTPVVLSKQSGASEVLDHAFKVDYWDTDKMADCILTILREEPLARQLRAEAPRLLKRLSWSNQAAAVRSIYHDSLHS